MPHHLHHQAGTGIEGNHCHPFGTSRQQALAGGEVEVAFGFLAAMTFDTVLVQQAADLLEQGEATGHPLGVVGRQRRRPSRKDP